MDIRTALRDRGFRQRDLAQRLSVPESTVSRWLVWARGLDGGIPIPATALSTIAEMTGIPAADLLHGLAQRGATQLGDVAQPVEAA